MAEKAFRRLERRMTVAAELRLAKLIEADAQQLHDRASEVGVSALLCRPVQRAPPNERFLKNTLRSVEYGNQKRDEEDMWRKRRQQLSRHDGEWSQNSVRRKSASSEYYGEGGVGRGRVLRNKKRKVEDLSSDDVDEAYPKYKDPQTLPKSGTNELIPGRQHVSDEDLTAFLNTRHVRGRGNIGPQQDTVAANSPPVCMSASMDVNNEQAREPTVKKKKKGKEKRKKKKDKGKGKKRKRGRDSTAPD